MPDWKYYARAAARWMRPLPCRWCWVWSSRNHRASAAAPSCFCSIPQQGKPPALTAAKRPPPRRGPACSWTRAASRAPSPTRFPAACRSVFPASSPCWKWRTRSMASCPGRDCSSPRLRWPRTAFRSAPSWRARLRISNAAPTCPTSRRVFTTPTARHWRKARLPKTRTMPPRSSGSRAAAAKLSTLARSPRRSSTRCRARRSIRAA